MPFDPSRWQFIHFYLRKPTLPQCSLMSDNPNKLPTEVKSHIQFLSRVHDYTKKKTYIATNTVSCPWLIQLFQTITRKSLFSQHKTPNFRCMKTLPNLKKEGGCGWESGVRGTKVITCVFFCPLRSSDVRGCHRAREEGREMPWDRSRHIERRGLGRDEWSRRHSSVTCRTAIASERS